LNMLLFICTALPLACVGERSAGTGDASTEGGPKTIVGDWFLCKNNDCSLLEGEGYGIRSDKTYAELKALDGALDPGEQYCERTEPDKRGTYTWDGEKIVIQPKSGKAVTYTVTLTGDSIITSGEGSLYKLRRISPPRLAGPCK